MENSNYFFTINNHSSSNQNSKIPSLAVWETSSLGLCFHTLKSLCCIYQQYNMFLGREMSGIFWGFFIVDIIF
jgi:hypothetical protein